MRRYSPRAIITGIRMTAHVVVIEDEPMLLEMISDVLAADGLVVTSVPYPDLDVKAWPQAVDVFLIDLMLPDHSGVETAIWLDAHGFRETPKICMSASSQVLRDAAASRLFDAVMPKPFDLSELIGTVRRLLGSGAGELFA